MFLLCYVCFCFVMLFVDNNIKRKPHQPSLVFWSNWNFEMLVFVEGGVFVITLISREQVRKKFIKVTSSRLNVYTWALSDSCLFVCFIFLQFVTECVSVLHLVIVHRTKTCLKVHPHFTCR